MERGDRRFVTLREWSHREPRRTQGGLNAFARVDVLFDERPRRRDERVAVSAGLRANADLDM